MSSPSSRRSQRNSQTSTPRRSARGSQAPGTSPAAGGTDQQLQSEASSARQSSQGTPRGAPAGRNVPSSSPLFFQSSPANPGPASSPLRQRADVDGDRTPRASGLNPVGDSSPIRYASSSSPPRGAADGRTGEEPRSSSSALFVNNFSDGTPTSSARQRRGDIRSDILSSAGRRRQMIVDERGMPVGSGDPMSDAATFSNIDPNTSDAEAMGGGSQRIIWGTNVSIPDSIRATKDFLLNFRQKYRLTYDGELEEGSNLPQDHPGNERVYVEMMKSMLELGVTALNLDARNLKAYPPTRKLWYHLVSYPDEIITAMDVAIKDVMLELAEKRTTELRQLHQQQQQQSRQNGSRARDSSSVPPVPSSDLDRPAPNTPAEAAAAVPDLEQELINVQYRVRPFGLDQTINLRELNPGDMDKLVSVKGLVIRTTPIIPDMKDAFFRCSVCGHTVKVDIERGKIAEPNKCPRQVCDSANSMQIVHNRSGFADKQVIKLQETPDNIPDGQTPHSVSLCVYDDLVDVCKAGDRVQITGIFKCNQVRVNPRQRTVKNIFKTYVDALHIQKTDKRRMGIDVTTLEEEVTDQVVGNVEETRKVTEEEEAKIKATAARPDVYELLSRSLAPSVYEMDDVKKGILLQLFGGTNKSFEKGGNPRYRGDINVLLCGDPSTSKSQLLKYVHRIAPRGVYTSGKGSSAVGLTAYVTRDPETRQLVLESGALVLSDGGVCCIDEFDKMNDSTRSVLHEVMEQQTVSIAKAGIITTLNARASILASANPIGSKYNPNLPVPQNIDLPPTLLSRFDLVYLVLDRIDEQNDRRLARHMVNMYLDDKPENGNEYEVLPVEFLTAYISYARAHIQPKLNEAASKTLVDEYVAMRGLGDDIRSADRRIAATTRQLESMIRLAEAHAKLRLSEMVEASDVEEAVRLIKSAIKQSATDQRTGLIDMSLLTEGTSAGERRRLRDMKDAVKAVVEEAGGASQSVRVQEVVRRLGERSGQTVETNEVLEVLRGLEAEGWCAISGDGNRRAVRRVVGVV